MKFNELSYGEKKINTSSADTLHVLFDFALIILKAVLTLQEKLLTVANQSRVEMTLD